MPPSGKAYNTPMRPTTDGRWLDTLVEQELIVVNFWSDGVVTNQHNRLDRVTRRIVPTALTDGEWTTDSALAAATALYMAAHEWYSRVQNEPVLPF